LEGNSIFAAIISQDNPISLPSIQFYTRSSLNILKLDAVIRYELLTVWWNNE